MLALTRDLFSRRKTILEFAKRDFQQQFHGSYMGFFWAFFQPLLFIAMLYVLFEMGFRSGSSSAIPFSVYLIAGMIPWLYFSSNLNSSTNTFRDYSFLIKKVDFRLSVLPLVKLIGSFPVHLLLMIVAVLIAWLEGYEPSIHTLQLFYYFAGMCVLLLGIGLITASTSIFVKDVKNLVSVITQFGFWLTPIFWNLDMFPNEYHYLLKLNPMLYITEGYRDSISSSVSFWEKPFETIYFWSISLFFLSVGILVYRKLKPHFAEVI